MLCIILAAGVLLAANSGATMRGKQLPGKIWTGVAADTTGATGMVVGDILTDYSTGKLYLYAGTPGWILVKSINSLVVPRTVSTLDTLTAPGNFKPVCATGYTHATFVFTDSLVTTSATLQYRGKVAGVSPLDWFNLDAENDSTVYTAVNGTWARTFQFAAGTDSLRGKVLSEAGGTGGKFWLAIILWNAFK